MFKNFHSFRDMREIAKLQREVDKTNFGEANMSVAQWYELQHKLRLQQMAQARAAK